MFGSENSRGFFFACLGNAFGDIRKKKDRFIRNAWSREVSEDRAS